MPVRYVKKSYEQLEDDVQILNQDKETLLSERLRLSKKVIQLEEKNKALLDDIKAIELNTDAYADENTALRKLAHDYIQAYEKLAFSDALLTGEEK